jgi:hypothetical protein
MIEVVIRGKPKKIAKYLIKRAVEHFASKLFSTRLNANIDLLIKFLPPEHIDLGPNCCAVCAPRYEYGTNNPRVFDILISEDMSKKVTLLSLAHEMVHIKQFAKGELFEFHYKPGLNRWRGELYNEDDRAGDNYWFMPWEVEALGMEQGLVRTFVKVMKSEGINVNAHFRFE